MRFELAGREATFDDVILAWRETEEFRSLFISTLAKTPYAAFRWETPPVTAATTGRVFECVVLDSPGLVNRPDPSSFASQFRSQQGDVLEFSNLGRDAILVVPRPLGDESNYGHLAAFVRGAPDDQKHALWRAVGDAMFRRLGERPVWLSTAGAGVPWLHVRLDDRPKYYGHAPFRRWP